MTVMNEAAHDLLSPPTSPKAAVAISDRLSKELVIGLVGPIGSGVSTAAAFLNDILTQEFGYKVCPIIKMSDFIKNEAHRVGKANAGRMPLDAYVSAMQDAGNQLRARFGGGYLAEKAIERICRFRKDDGGYSDKDVHLPGRRAYIIDSLKNPEELDLLRHVYGEAFCIFGVFAPEEMRVQRLQDAGTARASIRRIVDRDQSEDVTFGQKTRKLFVESDFFVCNDKKRDELRRKIARFLDLMFDATIHTPTRAESAMYEASAAGANSACMSRQVGAAIVSDKNELIAVGWNDVPRFGGGLYTEDNQHIWDVEKSGIIDKDNRCFKWRGCQCHNETRKNGIVDKIYQKLMSSGLLKKGIAASKVSDVMKGTEIDSLIEFSRAIHAEMEAILSVAREGRHSLVGSTLYTSTYPCHNCARHIVASGISSVVYIEPYLKSLAIDLHSDSITEDPEDRSRVVFRQYDGVAPRNYLRLFKPALPRKEGGKLSRPSRGDAIPVLRVPLDGQADYEAKVIAELSGKEESDINVR